MLKARIVGNKWANNYDSLFLEQYKDIEINGDLVSNWVLTEILPGEMLKSPVWNGTQWDEGITSQEIEDFEKAKVAPLLSKVLGKIKRYSLALAMGKSVNDDLDYFEMAYINKYKMANSLLAYYLNNNLPNPDPYQTLLAESKIEGYATLNEYLNDVVAKFEKGSKFRDIALQMSEVLRKLVAKDTTEKALQRLNIVDSLQDNVRASDIRGIFEQVLNL
ncbi:hypothetical protein [Flavobacterium psychrophilum]|uniref:hypothetical protein n=1 Tax=Flavobacterium psychrophilum TaxID=96345 RepID=UPI002C8AF94E|nr:hypothetical protein [Flavobacterium psychrophilum]